MPSNAEVWAPVVVVALGDPGHGDDGVPLRVMGRVRTLIGEIGCSRTSASPPGETEGESDETSFQTQGALALAPSSADGPLVQWIEAGTESDRLEPLLDDRRRVVLIDTVCFGGKAGTVYHWHLENSPVGSLNLVRHFGKTGNMKLDHLAFWLEDELPSSGLDLIGIEPGDLTEGTGFSRPIRQRMSTICSQVTAILFRVLVEEGW